LFAIGLINQNATKEGKITKILDIIIILPLVIGVALVPISCTSEPPAQGSKLLLRDYPELFEREAMIVVPTNASQVELESATAIATKLQELAGNGAPIKNDAAFVEADKSNFNLILVGTPNSNSILEQIYNLTNLTKVTKEYPGENKGILQILENPWNPDKALLMVVGSDDYGVKAGSEALTNDEKIKELSGGTVVTEFVDGSSVIIPSDTLNSVMDYIKQNHPDAANFISEDISWTKSSETILVGHTRNVYTGDGWTVTLGRSAIAEIKLEVSAEYNNQAIVWVGTIKDSVITESSYSAK
jgi:hypothetical protein